MIDRESLRTDLLMAILKCGYKDLERLEDLLYLASKLGIDLDNIMEHLEEVNSYPELYPGVNTLIYFTMRLILNEIADDIETEYGDPEVAERVRDFPIYANYMDSWFGINVLDRSVEELESLDRRDIVREVYEEVRRI